MMSPSEKIEFALIPMSGLGFWLYAPELPSSPALGTVFLALSVLLLLQSLIRDLYLMTSHKRTPTSTPVKKMRCMCLESTLGITGIIIGIGIAAFGLSPVVSLSHTVWAVLGTLVLSTGFVIKDWIVDTNPWRIRREKDHMNVVFTWKK